MRRLGFVQEWFKLLDPIRERRMGFRAVVSGNLVLPEFEHRDKTFRTRESSTLTISPVLISPRDETSQ